MAKHRPPNGATKHWSLWLELEDERGGMIMEADGPFFWTRSSTKPVVPSTSNSNAHGVFSSAFPGQPGSRREGPCDRG